MKKKTKKSNNLAIKTVKATGKAIAFLLFWKPIVAYHVVKVLTSKKK